MVPIDRLEPRAIVLVKPSALGDIVHSLPVLSALREHYPKATITWVVNRAYAPLIDGHPDLTDALVFDRKLIGTGIRAAIEYSITFASELRRRNFDLVIDLQGLLRTGLMSLATCAPRRIGFAAAREGSKFAYTDRIRVPDANRIHAIDRYWRVVEALGAGDQPKRFHVPISPTESEKASTLLAGLPRPFMAFGVGSRWVTKRWLPAHFAELAARAQERFGGTCLFVGSNEDTLATQDVIAKLHGPVCDFTGKTTLPTLAALLAQADVMIANDTGPLHLASALGRPCIAPYTCTRVNLHGPYHSLSGGVETSVACGGSYLKTCPKMICMDDLIPDRLWPPLAEVLNAWATSSRSA